MIFLKLLSIFVCCDACQKIVTEYKIDKKSVDYLNAKGDKMSQGNTYMVDTGQYTTD